MLILRKLIALAPSVDSEPNICVVGAALAKELNVGVDMFCKPVKRELALPNGSTELVGADSTDPNPEGFIDNPKEN